MIDFLTKNIALKIVAFILALMFWFNVVTNKSYEHEFDVSFQIQDISENLILTTPPPEQIKVRLSGTGKQIIAFLVKKPTLLYSASEFERGIYKIELKPEDLSFNDEITAHIVAIHEPQNFTFKFEKLEERTVKIKADVKIKPAPGYTLIGDLMIEPDSIKISGPRRFVRYLKSISTEKLELDNIKKSVNTNLALNLVDSMFLRPEVNFVKVVRQVVPLIEKKIGPVEIQTYNSKLYQTIDFAPESLHVIIEGPKGIIDSLNPSNFSVSLNFRNIEPGTTAVLPKIVVPTGYRLIDTEPNSISVTAISK